ncbi:MAU2 chromatid cohesion factor-like protein [Larimichthys crocea]|uniref:Uncharacterized protein n=1 Tax=Larimichthys crocea TaxID=215358 RepID=A0ACD3QS06_LARCR|nr:MAU2 chromatid cohesion factor-like protein [Larimichthys crocea]
MHSMQAGYLEKAQKYTDQALMQLEKLKMLNSSPILSTFQVILLKHIIMCRLVTGHKATALQEISQVCQLCQQSPRLFTNHAAQLQSLLGLYCISVNCMDNAEAQFTAALQMTTHQELWTFIVTNLASVYILGRQQTSRDLNKACGNTIYAHEAGSDAPELFPSAPAGPHRCLQPP